MSTPTRPRCRFHTATTLDGFLADEHDGLEWLLSQDHDDDGPGGTAAYLAGVGAIVMGATTYLWVVDHLAAEGGPWPYDLPTFVFTHRDLPLAHDTVRLVSGDPADLWPTVADAAGEREVWMVGGGLAADFAAAGLLDEVLVSIAPVTLGSGRPLFTRRFDLELLEVDRNRAFVVARYRVVGPRREGGAKLSGGRASDASPTPPAP